jgi:hypothetical protein
VQRVIVSIKVTTSSTISVDKSADFAGDLVVLLGDGVVLKK